MLILFILAYDLEIKFESVAGTFLNKNKEHELRIFYKIPKNQIIYIKAKDRYIAKLEVIGKLKQKHKEFGNIKYITDTIYQETYITETIEIKAPPGNYNLELQIKDLNSKRIGKIKSKATVKDLKEKPFSSIIVIDTTIYFEVYNFLQKNLVLSYEIGPITGEIEIDTPFINPSNIYFKKDTLPYGKHIIKLAIENFIIEDTIYIEEPPFLKNYEKRVEQLYYIAEKKERDSLAKAPKEKREMLWKKFWAKQDSIFGRPNIEEEYFRRVDYANEKFSCGIEGWKTDRGRVYIKLGPPDEIESYPFEVDQDPYEVWYYYRKGLKFVFVDKHGFGEYVLVYPKFWREEIQFE